MAFKDKLSKECFEHFQSLDKNKLRALSLTEDEICFLYDLDVKFNLTLGMSISALSVLQVVGFDNYLNKLFIYLNEHTFKNGEGVLPLDMVNYVITEQLTYPELDEYVDTELYFNAPELLKGLTELRKKFKNKKVKIDIPYYVNVRGRE